MKKDNISFGKVLLKIVLFPVYLIKYAFLGVLSIFYLIFNIFKYFFLGIKVIIFFISSIFRKKDNLENDKNLKDRNVEGSVINDQSEIDKIFEKQQEKEKKAEQKRLLLEEKREKKRLLLESKKEKKQEQLEKRKQELELAKQEKEKKAEQKRLLLEEKNVKKQEELDRKREIEKQKKLEHAEKNELKKQKREEIRKQKNEKKAELKAIKEQKKLEQKEKALSKKKKNEDYINENYKGEKQKFGTKLKSALREINNLPEKIKKSYQNSLLYKNAKNKKDQERQVLLINFDGEDAVKSEEKQVYEYIGKNAEGKEVKDYFPAFSRVEVHSFLLSEGYEVYSIRTSKWINFFHKSSASVSTKFKTKDLLFFLTQLSTYIKAGIPLVESLKILSRQFKNKSYQKIFRAMIYDLTMGESFSSAMDKQGKAFPKLLINMIKASEMTGELPEALDDMADYYTEAEQTRKQMITALTYPSIVFVFALAVITFIMIYVVPQFVDIYKSMDEAQIPGFTLLVMNISYFLQDNIIWIFIGIILVVLLIAFLYRNVKSVRWAIQWFLMHLPIIKNIIIYNEVTMFTKTFSSLLSHNVFITDTLEILSKITNNEIYKMLVRETAANLERGEKISTAYKDQWAFPIPAYEMIVTGERTGQLSEMMAKVSAYYQDLHRNTVTRIKAFVEPILIVFLTVVVGFIVLAIIIPMFNMYNQVI